MNIFDTHSDTPFELFRGKLDLYNDVTHISLDKIEKFEKFNGLNRIRRI